MEMAIAAGLYIDVVKDGALQGFVDAVLPLMAFSVNVSPEAGKKFKSVSVGLVGGRTAADFAGNYTTGAGKTVSEVEVSLTVHKFDTVTLTDVEANETEVKLYDLGYQSGKAVGVAMVADFLSIITAATYGAAIYTGAASAFDSDDLVDIRTALNTANVPKSGRKCVLDSDYIGALLKDDTIKGNDKLGTTDAIQKGMYGELFGMSMFESDIIPSNSENLVGFAGNGSGIAIAMRYLAPQDGNVYSRAEPLVDPDTGLVLGMREWHDPNTGTKYLTFEALGGKAAGIAAGLKRIVSA
jgi:hypothetical protein